MVHEVYWWEIIFYMFNFYGHRLYNWYHNQIIVNNKQQFKNNKYIHNILLWKITFLSNLNVYLKNNSFIFSF